MTRMIGMTARFLVVVLVFALASGAAAGERGFDFATTPGKLPKSVVPLHYAIELRPDLETLRLPGTEIVEIEVREATDRLVLNAVAMTIEEALLEGEAGQVATVALDEAAQTATLSFPKAIAVGKHRLRLAFTGKINRFGRGLFFADYPAEGGAKKRMLASHLEPADARRIFPSWDEPAFKASFEPSVVVPDAFDAVSNMPATGATPAGPGLKRIAFAATPPMSSYLFVLAAGELERLDEDVDGVRVSVVATKGKSAQGSYALDTAVRLLRYYNDYFGVRYPLPKLDLIAVPGGFGGAMENWGGIIFFESRLLFDPLTTAPGAVRGHFAIIAHEMAHMWFGDLVTMAWWDDLWLNEGFASWMEAKAGEALNPDWRVWLDASGAKQGAMSQDARRTTHPIQQKVADESEAMAAFDGITYNNGKAFIRQLESYLGEEPFRDGIRLYMASRAYGNATTADLWAALELASGKKVAEIAALYTEQPGVPFVIAETVCSGDAQALRLRQERFTVHDPATHDERWTVPIVLGLALPRNANDNGKGAAERQVVALAATALAMEIPAGRCGDLIKLNLGDLGYYRVQHDGVTSAALGKSIAALAPADRVNLLSDAWALVEAGRTQPAAYLDLVERLDVDDERAVWDQVMRVFGQLDHLEQDRPQRDAFRAYARARLRPLLARLTWEAAPGESLERGLLRGRVVRVLGELDETPVVAEAQARFARFLAAPASLPPALRDAVLTIAGRNADRGTYDALIALARRTTSTEERMRAYTAAAGARDAGLAEATLALTLGDELPTTLVGGLLSTVAGAGEHRDRVWRFVKEHFDAYVAKQGPSFADYFAARLLGNFSDPAHAEELSSFAPIQATTGGRIAAARTQEEILTKADFIAETLPAVEAWVAARGR
jgi:aminopeptidase N